MSKKKKYFAEELRVEVDPFSEKSSGSVVIHAFRSQQERDAWVKEDADCRAKISSDEVKKNYDKKDIISARFNQN